MTAYPRLKDDNGKSDVERDWEDQHVLSINREPARAAFMPYQAKKGDSQMLLNGEWTVSYTHLVPDRILLS